MLLIWKSPGSRTYNAYKPAAMKGTTHMAFLCVFSRRYDIKNRKNRTGRNHR